MARLRWSNLQSSCTVEEPALPRQLQLAMVLCLPEELFTGEEVGGEAPRQAVADPLILTSLSQLCVFLLGTFLHSDWLYGTKLY